MTIFVLVIESNKIVSFSKLTNKSVCAWFTMMCSVIQEHRLQFGNCTRYISRDPILKDKHEEKERTIRGEETKKLTNKMLKLLTLSTNNLKSSCIFMKMPWQRIYTKHVPYANIHHQAQNTQISSGNSQSVFVYRNLRCTRHLSRHAQGCDRNDKRFCLQGSCFFVMD